MPAPIIAIDGPAAAGKGTLARRLAAELGLPYLDTGLLYRATTRRLLDPGADPSDPEAATKAAALRPADLDRTDLRGPVADAAAAAVAAIPAVRAALLDFQRGFATERGGVLDGRDIGTVIFPAAPAKLFVTASAPERARGMRRAPPHRCVRRTMRCCWTPPTRTRTPPSPRPCASCVRVWPNDRHCEPPLGGEAIQGSSTA
jgi:cytidylate kinase